jgi:hypothetical protein
MVTLYDPKTGDPVNYSDNNSARADLLSGKVTTKVGQTFNISNESGQGGSVAGIDLPKYLQQNYQIETPKQSRINAYLEENKDLAGDIDVGAKKAISELALGIPELVFEHTSTQEEKEQWEAYKNQHEAAAWIGGGLGVAGSMVAGGPLFKGAAKAGMLAKGAVLGEHVAPGLVRSVAAHAIGGAAEGAVISSPRALTEAVLGDPGKAAEDLLLGAGLGFGLGGVSKIIGESSKLAGKGMVKAIESMGGKLSNEETAARALIAGSERYAVERINKMATKSETGYKVLSDLLKEEGLVIGPIEKYSEYLDRVKENYLDAGKNIGEFWRNIKEDQEGLISYFNSKSATPEADLFKTKTSSKIIDELKSSIEKYRLDPSKQTEYKSGMKWIEDLEKKFSTEAKEQIQNSTLWEIKKSLGEKIYNETRVQAFNATPLNKEYEGFRKIIDNTIDENMNNIKKSSEDIIKILEGKDGLANNTLREMFTEIANSFDKKNIKQLNKRYSILSDIHNIVKRSGMSEAVNDLRGSDIFSTISGGISGAGYSGAGISLAMGHPLLALGGIGVGLASSMVKKFWGEHGKKILANLDRPGLVMGLLGKAEGTEYYKIFDKTLDAIVVNGKQQTIGHLPSAIETFNNLSGNKEKDLESAYDKAKERVLYLKNNPEKVNEILDKNARYLADGAPQLAIAYKEKALQQIETAYATMPKTGDVPLFGGGTPKPSRKQMKTWSDVLVTLTDPIAIQKAILDKKITPEMVTAFQTLYPNTYSRHLVKLAEKGYSPEEKLQAKQYGSVSMLAGKPLSAYGNVASYQKIYQPAKEAGGSDKLGESIKIKNLPGAQPTEYGNQQQAKRR